MSTKRKKRSIIWAVTSSVFKTLVKNSDSYSDLMRKLGIRPIGANHITVKQRIKTEGIDVKHFYAKPGRYYGKTPLENILRKGVAFNTHRLKCRLLEAKIFENVCERCKRTTEWEGEILSLHLDHKDGDRTNNELSNLRLLCPNCHSLTPNYTGKKRKGKHFTDLGIYNQITINRCFCGVPISKGSTYCRRCAPKRQERVRKVPLPTKELLLELVSTTSFVGLGKHFGVSDNAVRKWFRYYGLNPKEYSFYKNKVINQYPRSSVDKNA